jgi:hypothetical protein
MKLKILCTLAAAMMTWSGVAHSAAVPKPPEAEISQLQEEPETRPVDPERAKAHWQWVGLSESSTCPHVDGWSEKNLLVRALFGHESNIQDAGLLWSDTGVPVQAGAEPGSGHTDTHQALFKDFTDLHGLKLNTLLEDIAELRRLKLDRFCVYEATSTDTDLEFQNPDGLKAAKPDRMVVSPAGLDASNSVIGMANWPNFARLFENQTGKAPLNLKNEQPRVRLVFLDTQQDGEGVPATADFSYHGYTMAHLADRLVCSDGDPRPCAAQIATSQALPYRKFLWNQRTPPVGGNLGLLNDLTTKILQEVWKWRRTGSPEHLVLNLSLGWDGELFGDLKARRVSQLEPSVQAVYKALRFASNSGALVIAAAGNRRGGPNESTWPLLPAAWELRRPSFLPFCLGHKRVYAVGGVDWQGLPLSNFRLGGRPRRTAYGIGGLEQPAIIYIGTSVSAAITSSIAAVVWHLRPDLKPAQVMKLIQRSGRLRPSRADFYPQRGTWLRSLLPAPRMRQISLCRAVKRACQNPALCPGLRELPQCQNEAQTAQKPPDGDPPLTIVQESRQPRSLPFVPPCDPSTWFLVPGTNEPRSPCPTEQYGSMASQRWTAPQPDDPPCPGCPLKTNTAVTNSSSSYILQWEISQAWQYEISSGSLSIRSATLDIERFVAGRVVSRRTYPIFADFVLPNNRLISIPGDGPLAGCTARLNFEIISKGQPMSVVNPLVVYP